ncbi:MAG: response regulator [Deltaproteobacteria bacterium]|nr:MAG: response regulator [Deltaproteobacteria bacterium]
MAENGMEPDRLNTQLNDMVVLVDDEPNIRETVAFILEAEGVEVETGSDGVEGLEAVRRCKPKVVLLDVMMPRMDGYEVCRAIRSDPELQGVFVMILTARGQKSDEAKALEVGADLYMSKPFDDEVVMQVIRDVFDGRLVSKQGSTEDGPVVHYQRTGAGAAG